MSLYFCARIFLCHSKFLAINKIQPQWYSSSVPQSFKDDTGALDDFTEQLMQKKSSKWETKKKLALKNAKRTLLSTDISKRNSNIDTEQLDVNTINLLFEKAIDYNDTSTITDLTQKCIRDDKIPSLNILINALAVCSRNGDQNTIVEVSQLCEKVRPEILQENSNFEHYIAEAVWIKGDIIKSLKIFERVYKENIYLRRKIRCVLKHLILNSVASQSEATVVNFMQFSELLVKEYNDYFPLACLWQACILSEWFTDQQLALDLLDKHEHLCSVILNKLPFVVRISLRHNRTEVVYRLTEVLLKFKMDSEIGSVLLALLDYWIQQGDFRQCKEIVLWSVQNNIEVPTVIYNKKLMEFLTKDAQRDFKANLKSDPTKRTRASDYKF